MSRVRGKNTGPERLVRSLLHRMGYRFRLHVAKLPGKPDIVMARHHTVVFVNGCFWHQHPGCKRAGRPATHIEFWNKKLDGNIARDTRNYTLLREQSWRVIMVWECQIKDLDALAQRLEQELRPDTTAPARSRKDSSSTD